MEKIINHIQQAAVSKSFLAGGGAIFLQLFGQPDKAFWSLVFLALLDFITGILKAYQAENISSRRLRDGAVKLILYAIFLATFQQLSSLGSIFGFAENFAVLYLGATEAISILENIHAMGIAVPEFIIKKLKEYQSSPNEDADNKSTSN